jgi:transposase
VLRFNAHGPAGLRDGKAPGREPALGDQHRAALAAIVESGPVPAVHGVVRWRVIDLCQWLWDEFGISVAGQTLGRTLREMGCRKLSARPRHHAQAEGAVERFKRMARPVCKQFRRHDPTSLHQRIRPVAWPGQDGDPRAPVLIKLTASERHF